MGRRAKPPSELQDDIYSVRLTAEASKRLQELATATGRRRSDVIRSLIADGHIVQTTVPKANLHPPMVFVNRRMPALLPGRNAV
jgi:hypothetical protein